jgi:lipopolysaccharide/colanic/teichoic acid biosynthesis glycosyltransferase
MYKLEHDPRVTRVGRLLRRTSIDELPQLFNVLRGEMSLVGPRPEIAYALPEYEDWHWRRFSVLPGMTGLWQVSGRGCLPPREMLRLDVQYADTWSLGRDLSILLRTIPAVVGERGSR